MKTAGKLLSVLLVAAMLGTLLTACGNTLDGTYKADAFGSGMAYTFDGKSVTLNVTVLGTVIATVEGTYEIEDGYITMTFAGEDESAQAYSGTFEFSADEDGDSIKIGVVEYEREDG